MELDQLKNWFKEIYIHEDSWNSEVARRVRDLCAVSPVKVSSRPYPKINGLMSGEDFNLSKQRLYLSCHEGHFFRKCPGTFGAACCNYFVLNLGAQCDMNCSYCYLQSYLNSPLTHIYTNIDQALLELEKIVKQNPDSSFRVGTGEVIDSLSLDDLSGYSKTLVEWFSQYPHLTCEFKTKSNNIKNFIDLNHAGNVVVSFSVNPESIVTAEEHRTAPLKARLAAARRACDRGFPVAFHIDPMIYVEGWQTLYGQLVEEIVEHFKPTDLKWISIGALRFPPDMKQILRERFGSSSQILKSELFLSRDGKLRYDQRLRNEMFRHVAGSFHKSDKNFPVFLCMESPESWMGTFENTPGKVPGLEPLFKPTAFNL